LELGRFDCLAIQRTRGAEHKFAIGFRQHQETALCPRRRNHLVHHARQHLVEVERQIERLRHAVEQREAVSGRLGQGGSLRVAIITVM